MAESGAGRPPGGNRAGAGAHRPCRAAPGPDAGRYPDPDLAGTNGKGSCVAAAEAALGAAGLRVGCYTSPHLQHYSERVRVEGQRLDEATLCEGFARGQAARGEVPLTFFEFGTPAALGHRFAAKP